MERMQQENLKSLFESLDTAFAQRFLKENGMSFDKAIKR